MATGEDLYPLAVLIDELRHDDVAVRVDSMKRVTTIALALGEERTRNELLPFLEDAAQEDEDEILTVMAKELAQFVPLVGGQEYAPLLLTPLSTLASCEEQTVRTASVEALENISHELTKSQLSDHYVKLILQLAKSDWFSSRMSATGLFKTVLKRLPDQQGELLKVFQHLIADDTPMVRRASATALPELIESLGDAEAPPQALLEMFKTLFGDDQDSVRLLSVNIAVSLAKKYPRSVPRLLFQDTVGLIEDRSWRVRYMAASKYADIAESMQPANQLPKFLSLYVELTKDTESEVRAAVAKQTDGVCQLLSENNILDDVVPCLDQLVEDQSEGVREALATQISNISPKLGREKTIEYLLPLFLHMLKDENSEVRLQIISNLQVINEVIGIDLLSQSLLPAIQELAKDKQWRVLLAIIDYSPLLAEQLGMEFFNEELVPLVVDWLWDPIWAIRDAAARNLVKLADVFGLKWLETVIVPKLVVPNPAANYLYRLTALLAIKTIIPTLSPQCLEEQVLPFVLHLVNDPVPNIRFNCVKALNLLSTNLVKKGGPKSLIADKILPVLEHSADDTDQDVRFFVKEALDSIEPLQVQAA